MFDVLSWFMRSPHDAIAQSNFEAAMRPRVRNMTDRELMILDAVGGCDGREKTLLAKVACQTLTPAELRQLVTELDRQLWKDMKP